MEGQEVGHDGNVTEAACYVKAGETDNTVHLDEQRLPAGLDQSLGMRYKGMSVCLWLS
jgi:hypothetical protein